LKPPVGRIVVQVVPRARRTQVIGSYGDAIRIRVAAPPVDGAANEELVRHIAERLRVPHRAVTISHGLAARRKTILINGLATNEAVQRLIAES
jgi:hypothetical protein